MVKDEFKIFGPLWSIYPPKLHCPEGLIRKGHPVHGIKFGRKIPLLIQKNSPHASIVEVGISQERMKLQ